MASLHSRDSSTHYQSSTTTDDARYQYLLPTQLNIPTVSYTGGRDPTGTDAHKERGGERAGGGQDPVRRKRKKHRRRDVRAVSPSLVLTSTTSDTEDYEGNAASVVSAGEDRGIPRRYQSLPRLDLGSADPKAVTGDAIEKQDPHNSNVICTTNTTSSTSRRKTSRKLSKMTLRYVEHYKDVVSKQRQDGTNMRRGAEGEHGSPYKMFSPRRQVASVSNDIPLAPIDKGCPASQVAVHSPIVASLTTPTQQSPHMRCDHWVTMAMREDMLKALHICEDLGEAPPPRRNPSGGVTMEESMLEEAFRKPWFHDIEHTGTTVMPAGATSTTSKTSSSVQPNRKPLEERVDEVIGEYERVPGLVKTGSRGAARHRKLGALVSPRRLTELLGCTSPIRMEDRHNHYL